VKIHNRILLAVLVLGAVIGIAGYTALCQSRHTLVETVGNQSIELANITMNHMYDSIQQRMEDLQCRSLVLGEHPILVESNNLFDKEDNISDLIVSMEETWISNSQQSQISEMAQNDLSRILHDDIECSDYYVKKQGYRTFGELFITNKYGANIAHTSTNPGFFQGKETWWQHAKDYGTYVGPIEYDESRDQYVVDLVIRLNSKTGEFSGVLKTVYHISQLTSIFQNVKYSSAYDSMRLRLLTNQKVIFDTQTKVLLPSPLEPALMQRIVSTQASHGYFETSAPRTLTAFYASFYADRPDTLDSLLLIEFDPSEVLARLAKLKQQLMYLGLILFVASALGGVALAQSISKPLMGLKNMAFSISCGNLDVLPHIHATGEIGQLVHTFEQMVIYLAGSFKNLKSVLQTRHATEIELASSNEELKSALEEFERVNEELKNFACVASHELKEPLRKISLFGSKLHESFKGHIDPDDEAYLNYMVNGANRLTRLVNTLVDHSQIGRKDDLFESIDLNTVMQDIETYGLAQLIDETRTVIDIPDLLPVVCGDPVEISQLFQNLMANAIKFRREAVTPVITIESHTIDNNRVCIEVQDNGIGIPPQHHKNIFDMFRCLHTQNDFEGSGIGLATCKKIVDHHGGEIHVESYVDKGSRFSITLPIAIEASTSADAVKV